MITYVLAVAAAVAAAAAYGLLFSARSGWATPAALGLCGVTAWLAAAAVAVHRAWLPVALLALAGAWCWVTCAAELARPGRAARRTAAGGGEGCPASPAATRRRGGDR